MQDYILNNIGYGNVGSILADFRQNQGMLRPFIEDGWNHAMRGRACVIANAGVLTGEFRWKEGRDQNGKPNGTRVPDNRQYLINHLQQNGINSPVMNATSLRKEEWITLDRQILKAARYRLRAWADLAAANSYGGFNGMSKMILEHEMMSDAGEAIVDMEGVTEGRTDSPLSQLQGLPLPITHSDFFFTARRLAISRNSSTPLDTTMGEMAGRRCAETVEKTTIGIQTGTTYGGTGPYSAGSGLNYANVSQVYGYTNFPQRLTNTAFHKPTTVGWVPATTLKDVLAARDQLRLNKFFGPYMIYTSNDWDQYLDNDYILTGGNVATQTLRERLRDIEDIADVRRLDFLFASAPPAGGAGYSGVPPQPGGENLVATFPFTMLFVQMTPDVARAVNGMDITTLQWETVGGMKINFKVMCIQVPQLRHDFYNNCGILHATATI